MDALAREAVVDVSAGEQHTLAVTEFGDVFAWCVRASFPVRARLRPLTSVENYRRLASAGAAARRASWGSAAP